MNVGFDFLDCYFKPHVWKKKMKEEKLRKKKSFFFSFFKDLGLYQRETYLIFSIFNCFLKILRSFLFDTALIKSCRSKWFKE